MANTTGQKFGGRTKGTPNKTTGQIRECFQSFIANNLENMQKDFNQLDPKERLKVIIDLSRFVIPTFKAIELKTDEDKKQLEPVKIIFQVNDENENV